MSLAVLSDGFEALSKTLPGSILVLSDGSFRVTSLETPFGTKRAHGLPDVFISEKVEVAAKAVKQDWLIGSVDVIYMGVMTEGGLTGSRAAALAIQGQPASIEVAGSTGEVITKLRSLCEAQLPRSWRSMQRWVCLEFQLAASRAGKQRPVCCRAGALQLQQRRVPPF